MTKHSIRLISAALGVAAFLSFSTAIQAKTITLRIASGHPPGVVYAGLMKNYFQKELQKQVAKRTKHKIRFIVGYSGSIVKVYEVFEGVRDGIVDIGGFCFCFEPSNLPLHAFQVMLPFGTMDPVKSLKIAQDVYKQVPYLSNVFEKKFNQKLLSRIADGGYNLGTSFDWNKVSDLKGIKIAGAGLNLNWLKYAGVTPVQGSLPEAYTGLRTHNYEGWIMFPSAWVKLKLYEPGPFYTTIGFGSITWHALTINTRKWKSLPKNVQKIMMEVAAKYKEKTGSVNKDDYAKHISTLKKKITVKNLGPKVRNKWAKSLKNWPMKMAKELDAKGLPGTKVLKLTLEAAEKHGYKWPVRYKLK